MPGSVVTVQLGQCGNQVGAELFATLAGEAEAAPPATRAETYEAFFRRRDDSRPSGPSSSSSSSSSTNRSTPRAIARAVLVDMEPKVIHASMRSARRSGTWQYEPNGSLAFQSGSGNNWARGYNTYGTRVREEVLELVRRETEACDHMGGFLLMQSMAGGTGAGLGAYVAETLREDYPSASLLNHCIWPYESGEVIVQAYNTLLTLSTLLDVSDGIVIAQNEHLHAACRTTLGLDRPTFDDMNGVAARQLAGVLLPASTRACGAPGAAPGVGGVSSSPGGVSHRDKQSIGGGGAVGECGTSGRRSGGAQSEPTGRPLMLLHDVTRSLCCHPSMRLLSLRSVPMMPTRSVDFTTFTWPALMKRTRQMLLSGTTLEEGLDWGLEPHAAGGHGPRHATRCLGSMLFLRGRGAESADVSVLGDARLYPRWVPQPLTVASSSVAFSKYEMSATLLSNCQTPCPPVGRMLTRAYQMHAARAFTHQYAEHGVGSGEFEEAFCRVEDVLAAYRAM